MQKFKVGDLVIVRDYANNRLSNYFKNRIGETLVVDSVNGSGWVGFADISTFHWVPERFEPAPKADEVQVGTFIISLMNADGTLAPNTNPRIYSSDAQAKKVAAKMAKKHSGSFVVFKATDIFEMPVAEPTHRSL